MKQRTTTLLATSIATLFAGFSSLALAAESTLTAPTPNLPPAKIVVQILRANPTVQAASNQRQAEEANRNQLEAGPYEWNVRLGGQQRKSKPTASPEEKFNEWNAALERPLRLPGKASLDAELGAAGVALAETAQGDSLHETSRNLLKSWFTWLKESASAAQWQTQVDLLEKQTKGVQRRQQLGDAAQLESIQTEAALAQAKAQLALAKIRQQTASEDLRRRYPGLPMVMPKEIAKPTPITGTEAEWLEAILKENHELGIARGESRKAQAMASRSSRDRMPDPTFGIHVSSERGGEDQIVGAYISIPLPGGGRRAHADASRAEASAASYREAATQRRIEAESAALYQSAKAAVDSWQASQHAAEKLTRVAEMNARAYQLGEGNLNDLLNARRFANEAQLTARLSQLDALELGYRLKLDAHRLWEFD